MENIHTNELRADQSSVLAGGAGSQIHGALPDRDFRPGIGATEEFNLRVSTAVLGRLHFAHPDTGEEYLVFERKCSSQVRESGEKKTTLNAQPLGGASILKRPQALWSLIGGFNYDTEKSRDESDFRVQVRGRDWNAVRDFCVEHFSNAGTKVIEADIKRELAEEFHEALGLAVRPEAYIAKNVGIRIQEDATASDRLGVSGLLTCRVFNVHDVEIKDSELIRAILKNGNEVSNESLVSAAEAKAALSPRKQGKVTALIALPRAEVEAAHAQNSDDSQPVRVQGHKLISTVAVTLSSKE